MRMLLKEISNRPIVVWGARMTGIGFLKLAEIHSLNIVGIVDSDPTLHNQRLRGYFISNPSHILDLASSYNDLIIVITNTVQKESTDYSISRLGLPSNIVILEYSSLCSIQYVIDISGVCNLKCPSCARSIDSIHNPVGFMSVDDYQNILDKIIQDSPYTNYVCLYSWGEPLLHKNLNAIIEYTHSKGIAVAISTNLSIDIPNCINDLIKLAPDYLKISVSGYYPDVYNTTHTGGNIDLVKSNLYRLRYLVDKYNSDTFIEVNYHMYKNNIGIDLQKFKDLCNDLKFVFSQCTAFIAPVERLVQYCEAKGESNDLAIISLCIADPAYLISSKPYSMACPLLTNQININWDRSVSLCCASYIRQNTTVSNDYLRTTQDEITESKRNHRLCSICKKYSIPSYFLENNQKIWQNG